MTILPPHNINQGQDQEEIAGLEAGHQIGQGPKFNDDDAAFAANLQSNFEAAMLEASQSPSPGLQS